MKSYTDLEQSKKLAEILPLESADMSYRPYRGEGGIPDYESDLCPYRFASWSGFPCWSLAALLDILPSGTELLKFEHSYHCQSDMCDTWALNPIGACVETIEKLHKQMIYDFNNS